MNTAVLISGQTRTFKECWRNQYAMLYRHLPNPVFYCCVEDDGQSDDLNLIRDRFKEVYIKKIKTPDDLPRPDESCALHTPSACVSPTPRLLKTFWNLNHTWEFFQWTEAEFRNKADVVVKMRPDIYFRQFTMPALPLDSKEIVCPWWARSGGVNDRMAFAGMDAAKALFTVYPNIQKILDKGIALHGESMSKGALELGDILIRNTLRTWCAFKRLNGTMVEPDFNQHEVVLASRGE